MSAPVTIILTKNEAADLPACLCALEGWGRVIVVDSGSTDATTEIARAAGAAVYTHPFAAFGQQRNWALDHCDLSGAEWVLFLDADEMATPEFRTALERETASADGTVAGFYCCWKTLLLGQWLRRCDSFPKWQFRLLRPGRARFIDSGHGQKEGEVDGRLAYLSEPYLHHAFSKGWSHWVRKHNEYSTLEAADRQARGAGVRRRDMLSQNGSVRNRALKPLVSRLPGWPAWRFLHMYLLKRGFLEGRAGWIFCVNMAYYEFLIGLKMRERPGGGSHPPTPP